VLEKSLQNYWESGAWLGHRTADTWRSHADWLHNSLLSRTILDGSLPGEAGVLLKTDLYEEAVGVGEIPELSRYFGTLYGVDVSEEVVDAARRKTPKLMGIVADVRALPFPDDSVDVVVSFSTLDHFEAEESISSSLREIARVLRPGGQALITLDNLSNPLVRLRQALPFRLLNRIGVMPYFCGATLTPPAFREAIEIEGLTVEMSTSLMHCPRVLAVALARAVDYAAPGFADGYLRLLRRFEVLGRWPTRYRTGYFTVMLCRKEAAPALDPTIAHP
jgi:SAM-dependent methyltransferase